MRGTLPENPNLGRKYNSQTLRRIYLAGGCFWGAQAYLSRLLGVAGTVCGYANGKTEHPTYEQVCRENTGHAETVQVDYDPALLSQEGLLLEFFKIINPTSRNRQGGDVGSQYRTGIYSDDQADLAVAKQVVEVVQRQYSMPIVTEVEPLQHFYPAEDYHQDYLEKHPGGYCHVDLTALPPGGVVEGGTL